MILQVKEKATGNILMRYKGDMLGTNGTAHTFDDERGEKGSSTHIIVTITGAVLKFSYADNHYHFTDITEHCEVLCDFNN